MEVISAGSVAEMDVTRGCPQGDFEVEGTGLTQWVGTLSSENRASELTMSAVTFPERRKSCHCTVLT